MGFDASLSVYLFICQSVSLSACYQLSDGVSLSGPLDWPVDQAPGLGDDRILSTYCSTQYTVHDKRSMFVFNRADMSYCADRCYQASQSDTNTHYLPLPVDLNTSKPLISPAVDADFIWR
ncbi:hypothetical protein RRG08_017920 [Elysia crispata]|uniref:Uncharacterized protein n=1 Tax=Elysia crispata TaxID=231223 RepID=A0AAE1CPM9_9GAST|nr:hypothetical protein RRG08_017920 [Elysia crispata]